MRVSYDLHIHSCLSPCGSDDMTPNNIVNMAALLGTDVIAVSDHNSSRNLPAVCAAATKLSPAGQELLVVPAVEACTSEEVHMLCLFETLEGALAFGNEIYRFLPPISNQTDVFGNQLILNEADELIGVEERLLINALTLGIEKLIPLAAEYGGVAIPAHANKRANSIVANLGFIPPEYGFAAIEVNPPDDSLAFVGRRISDSDAHDLEHMREPSFFMEIAEKTPKCVVNYLRGL